MPNDNTLFKEIATGKKKKKAQASEKDFVLTSTKKREKKVCSQIYIKMSKFPVW